MGPKKKTTKPSELVQRLAEKHGVTTKEVDSVIVTFGQNSAPGELQRRAAVRQAEVQRATNLAERKAREEEERCRKQARDAAVVKASSNDVRLAMLDAKGQPLKQYQELHELYTLCNNEALRSEVHELLKDERDPVNWATIHTLSVDKPFIWAVLAVARRTSKASWQTDSVGHYDCMYFNNGLRCSSKRPEHAPMMHCCICCGRHHALAAFRLRDLNSATHGMCGPWKRLAQSFAALVENCFPHADLEALERVAFRPSQTDPVDGVFRFTNKHAYDLALGRFRTETAATATPRKKIVAVTEKSESRGPLASTVASSMVSVDERCTDNDVGDGEATSVTVDDTCAEEAYNEDGAATTGTVDDASAEEASPREDRQRPFLSASDINLPSFASSPATTATGSRRVPLHMAEWHALFHSQYGNDKYMHEYRWYPEHPVENEPMLMWCVGGCCRMGSGGRHVVSQALFFQKANPRNKLWIEAVVKQYTVVGTDGAIEQSRAFDQEVKAFGNIYPHELLESNSEYVFNNNFPTLFIATRRHNTDLQASLYDEGELSLSRRLDLVRKVMHAVKMVHKDLVHGDIKPKNFVETTISDSKTDNYGGEESEIRLIDFEFSKLVEEIGDGVTATTVGWSADWCTPAQRRLRRKVQKTDDCYALALVLYEIVHGDAHGKTEQQNAPQYWLDLFAEAKEEGGKIGDFIDSILQDSMKRNRKTGQYELQIPEVPARCNPLLRTLMERLFEYYASFQPGMQPTTAFNYNQHLLLVDRTGLCCMMLRLQHELERSRNKLGVKQLRAFFTDQATKPANRAYYKDAPKSIVDAIKSECSRHMNDFDQNAELSLFDAIRLMRNLFAHPDFSLPDAIADMIGHCGEIFADLQRGLEFVAKADIVVTLDQRRQAIVFSKRVTS